MAQARACAGLETGVAEVPRLGPGWQPIARAGEGQLPGERGPGRQPWPGAAPPRSGWGDPRALGPDPVVIVPGVPILLFSIFLRSRLLRRAPRSTPPRAGARIPPCAGAGTRTCRGRSQSGSRQVRWIRRPVGFSRDGSRRMYPRPSRRRSDRRTVPGWRWTRAAIELSQGQQRCRPGRSRRGPPAPANRWAKAWGRRRCRGGWRRRGYSSCIGSPGRTLPPSGPRGRGRCGAPGCRAVHGCSPCSPARSRAWNVGAARTVRNLATRRARSSGASGPKRRDRGASEEFSVTKWDRPLQQSVGRLQ